MRKSRDNLHRCQKCVRKNGDSFQTRQKCVRKSRDSLQACQKCACKSLDNLHRCLKCLHKARAVQASVPSVFPLLSYPFCCPESIPIQLAIRRPRFFRLSGSAIFGALRDNCTAPRGTNSQHNVVKAKDGHAMNGTVKRSVAKCSTGGSQTILPIHHSSHEQGRRKFLIQFDGQSITGHYGTIIPYNGFGLVQKTDNCNPSSPLN